MPFVLFVLALLQSLSFCGGDTARAVPEEFNRGVELFSQGDVAGAIELWRKALEKDSTLAAAWFNMAVAYDISGAESSAVICYRRAAALAPNDPDPWIYLAQLYRRRGDAERTIEAYENAIHRKPDDPELLNGLAIAYDQVGDYGAALWALGKAIALDSTYLSAWVNKVIVHNHMSQHDSAAYYGELVTAMFPDEPVSWAQLGLAYHYLERDNDALAALDSSIAIFDKLAMAHYYRALVLLSLGNAEEAIDEVEQAVQLFPDYRDIAAADSELAPLRQNPRFKHIIGER